jgi:hypothetical protein
MQRIAPSLIALALASAPLTAADPEYSVFVLPADTGKNAFVNGFDGGALSPDGRSAIIQTEDANYNAKSHRWSFGGTTTQALTLAGFLDVEFEAVANNGLAIGTVGVNDDGFGFPASASGSTVTKRGTVNGDFADMNDGATLFVGGLFTTTTSISGVYTSARAKKWTAVNGAATDVLAGTSHASAPSFAAKSSANGGWIAGFLLDPTDLTGNAFLENTGVTGEPVVITAPFYAPDCWDAHAVANDGKAILGWGHDEDIGFEMAYLWNGTALSEVIPSDQTFFTRDWQNNTDLDLPLLGVWGDFAEVTGKGLMGFVSAHLDASSTTNPDTVNDYLNFRWQAGSGITELDTLMPAVAVTQDYYPYATELRPLEIWDITDITTRGQALAEVHIPQAATSAMAILTPVPVVSLTSTLLKKGEAGGSFTATVTRLAGPAGPVCTNWPLTVRLSYVGAAGRGTDFTGPLTVTIPAGQTAATVTMNIVNDTEVENPEAFTLRLVKPAAGSTTPQTLYRLSATQNRLTYLITDNDTVAASLDR